MNLRKYLQALKWEFLQNLPMILGFLAAARLWRGNLRLALSVLIIGIGLGILLMHFTEPFLHKEKYPPTWKGDLINLGLFVVFALPFLYYFSTETRWINWKSDLIAGVVVGVLLTLGQAIGWTGKKSRMVLHGVAMATSFPLILIGLRYALKIDTWLWMLGVGVLVTLLASMLITLIDYGEMYKKQTASTG
jgi:hypothetical protein